MTRRSLCAAALAAAAVSALAAAPAPADFLAHKGSFDGSASVPGGALVHPGPVAVNHQDGSVIVLDTGKAAPVEQFDLEGNPKPFAAHGASNSLGPLAVSERVDIDVDNSGTASEGNIYVVSQTPPRVYGFDSAGNPLGGNWPLKELGEYMCGVSVDRQGEVWVADAFVFATVEYSAAGTPTGQSKGSTFGCQNGFNSEGVFYTNFAFGPQGFGGASIRVEDTNGNTYDLLESGTDRGFDIDPATDDVYIDDATRIVQVDKTGATIASTGEAEDFAPFYGGLVDSGGLAYDPASKTVYASDFGATPPSIETFALRPPLPPVVAPGRVTQVRSTSAVIKAAVNPKGGPTKYSIEYGTDTNYGSSTGPADGIELDGLKEQPVTIALGGLQPGTKYHYRVVAENSTDRSEGPDQTFITYKPAPGADTCPNSLVRKQTGAASLADCRAYELASAEDTGGYNVSSDLVPGESPLPGFPLASGPSRLLYTLESGSIPGSGVPTSFVDDPYVATRGEDGWHTEYVGIPANGTESQAPFASSFSGADAGLDTFAFSGDGLCSPCFSDGKTGIPVRRPDGSIVQGMAGSLDPGAGAQAEILVRKRLSDDGTHLVFGSTSKFEQDAPAAGQPGIYVRDLVAGTTQVASKTPAGADIPCLSACATKGVAGLDISTDGSRVVVGQLAGTNPAGADLWHPYMDIDGSSSSIDLAPGATAGVLYYGMTDDGTEAFISSDERLTSDDHDDSVDVFRADVTPAGATLTRISQGSGAGDTNSCDPIGDAVHERWNSVGPAPTCDVVPVAGGGGIGVKDGSFYILSPELLDGPSDGAEDAPNLYVAHPDGDVTFVATLDSNLNVPASPTKRRRPIGEIGGFTTPVQLAIDPDTGFLYVADAATNTVSRFKANGEPAPFSFAAPYVNGNVLTGSPTTEFGLGPSSQLAVDESGTATDGYLYVADPQGSGSIQVFRSSGEFAGSVFTAGAPCGVAVGHTGSIYAAGEGGLYRWKPVDGDPANDAYDGFFFSASGGCVAANDSTGILYMQFGAGGPVKRIQPPELEGFEPAGITIAESSTGLAREAGSDEYLIDHGDHFDQFGPDGSSTIPDVGRGDLAGSTGVAAVAGGNAYATDGGGKVKIFGPPEPKPDPEISASPIAFHGVDAPDVRHPEDIQVEPEGGSSAFVSSMPLTGDVVGQRRQVFRFDAGTDEVDCASCNLTRVDPVDGASLAANGSSIASGGRVFFTTAEPLVLRDANAKRDVYQWSKAGGYELVSPGNSQFDNTLLSVSWDGVDAYFFTRNSLVPQDGNGELMKVYDARAGGGFFVLPPRVPCAASDECHGPGTQPPPRVETPTAGARPGNVRPKCGKGKVRRHGKCRPKPRKHRKHGHRQGGRSR